MVPVFCCGFECGQFGTVGQHWSAFSGSPSFSTTTVRSGSRSLRINPSAAAMSVRSPVLSSSNNFVIRFYVRFATLPTADYALMFMTGAFNGVYFQSSDTKIYAHTGSAFGSTGVSVTTDVWYRIDYSLNGTSVPALGNVKVNGVDCGVASGGATGPYNQISFGDPNSKTADIFIDDVVISQTISDYPIGNGTVSHFIPTSDGTHNIAGTADFQRTLTGTDILNATTTAFQLVDDVPLESGASVDWINMIAPPNATDYVECVFGPASGILTPAVAPRAVEVIAGIHHAGTGTGNMEIRMNDNGTTDVMYTATTVAGVTTVIYKRKHYAANIANGGVWTVTTGAGNFNNLRMRFGSPAAVDANPDQYLDCIMIEAEFAEPPQKIVNINQSVKRTNSF